MGKAHILYLYDDGISPSLTDDKREKLRSQVGEGVLKVCTDPDFGLLPSGETIRKTSAKVGHHMNAINFCSTLRSTEAEVFSWSENRLAKMEDLDDDEFRRLFEQVRHEKQRRTSSSQLDPNQDSGITQRHRKSFNEDNSDRVVAVESLGFTGFGSALVDAHE